MDIFKKTITKFISSQTKLKDIQLEIPPDQDMGDFAFPCFSLSKEMKKSPADIARELAKKFTPIDSITEARAIGPYLNFFISPAALAEAVISGIRKKNYGRGTKKERIMIEYSSPNTNKAQHLGHVRNNLLGMAISNMLQFQGYDVVKTCLMNDKGMGVAKAMLAYKLWGHDKKPDRKPDHFVAHWYVEFGRHAEKDPSLEEQAHEMNRLFEKKDSKVIALWKKMTAWVYEGYEETYKRLGCEFDKTYYESDIYASGRDIVEKALKKGIFREDDGAVIAELEEFKLPNKVLIKSDGTTLYITQDIYLAELKEKEFHMDRSIYVVGSEQQLHFQQLFAILTMLGHKWAERCYHLSYGMISLPEGKMKSREGTVVDADDLMDAMENLAAEEIRKRHINLTEADIRKRAVQIGIGALKFYMLKYEPAKDFLYDPKESVSFEGETGPYVQYAHARICSIFRKHGEEPKSADLSLLESPQEKSLLVSLSRFPDVIEDAGSHYKPSILCNYLISLAQSFNEFYHACPILTESEKIRDARLSLCAATRQILKTGLEILGIEAPEEM